MISTINNIARKANKNGFKVCQLDNETLSVEFKFGVYAIFCIWDDGVTVDYTHTVDNLKGTIRKARKTTEKKLA